VTLRGSVQDFPLKAVLELLAQTKKQGELQVRVGDRVGAIGIAGGRVVTAVFGEEEPLLALGAIFALEGAEFEFTPWDDAPAGDLEGTLDELLRKAEATKKRVEAEREAARRKAEAEAEAARKKAEEEAEAERRRIAEIRAHVPSDDLAFRLSERAVEQGSVTLTSERWRIVLAVNGERDVRAIASMLHLDQDAALTALAALVRDGVIETTTPTGSQPRSEPPPEPDATETSEVFEAPAPAFEPAAPAFESSQDTFPSDRTTTPEYAAPQDVPPAEEIPAAPDWITPDQAASAPDWTTASAGNAPISEVAPQWSAPETAAPAQEWITPETAAQPPAGDDHLSSLSGIFGPASTEPETAGEPAMNSWAPPRSSDQWGTSAQPAPAAERWSAPPAAEAPTPAASDDPWGAPPSPAKDTLVEPTPPRNTWSSPAGGGASSADPWGTPPSRDPRLAALTVPDPRTPPVEEWSAPAAAPAEKKKKGLFGFGREKPAPPVAGTPLPTAGVVGSRAGMLAALANALIAEYNSGQYGKVRIEERIANLLMRVDEQADPIDRPLPIVDDRIDVEALEREHPADSQALPYLALLVTTIFADAEKAFGKDKAKKGYRAAAKTILLGDASALSSPELAGKLPRV
jgi:hypothetical protein